MLTISDLSLRIAGRLLIENANVSIPTGSKVGIVGRNGTGKTTLFKTITGELETESGGISLPEKSRIGQVAQEAPSSDTPLIEIVLAADLERASLLEQAQTERDPTKIAEIQMRLADIDAHSAEARAATILAGLGFDNAAQQRPASEFSGGWRMRVALAAILFSAPDLLLLDEPTNYLDLEGTLWLETFLSRYPHTVMLISHDRDLLNRAVSSILHLENRKLTLFRGNYDQFSRAYAERADQAGKQAEKQALQRKHMEDFVERFRAKASKARQAQSRLKALERMGDAVVLERESVNPIRFPNPATKVASPVIALQGASVGYGGEPVLRNLNLRIDADDRIALLGANGNGKSTFAKLIAKRLEGEGNITMASQLKAAYFAQHQLDDLRMGESAVQHVTRMLPKDAESRRRAVVASMGLSSQKMDTPVETLSGGERARLLLGLAMMAKPNLIILDEPTNHLDIQARQSLIDAINDYEGAVILVSHDRHLIEMTVERLWLVADGDVKPYDGDMDDYRKFILSSKNDNGNKGTSGPKLSKADARKEAAAKRELMSGLAKEIKSLDKKVMDLNRAIKLYDEQLADTSLYETDPAKAARLGQQRGQSVKQLAEFEEQWLEKTTAYEAAMD